MTHQIMRRIFTVLLCAAVSDAVAQLPEQDCINAIELYSTNAIHKNAYSGEGLTDDVANGSICLQEEEVNSAWFIFSIQDSGMLEFTLTPDSVTDYDFALFDFTNSCCEMLLSANPTVVRCSYTFSDRAIGLRSGYTATMAGTTAIEDSFLAPLNVQAGETFALLISNFSGGNHGFTLSFSNTTATFAGSINTNTSPVEAEITATSPAISCNMPNNAQFSMTFSEVISCASIDDSDFTLRAPAGMSISTTGGVSCGNGHTSGVWLSLTGPTDNRWIPGDYTVIVHGNLLETYCGRPITDDSIQFTIPELVNAYFTYTISPGCNADTVHFTNQSTGNGTLTYLWDFNNGMTSTDVNPFTVYNDTHVAVTGLRVQGSECQDSISRDIDIYSPYNLWIYDWAEPCMKTLLEFKPLINYDSSNVMDSYHWDFGNGQTSTDAVATTVYDTTGTYNICLTGTLNCFTDTVCFPIHVMDCHVSAGAAPAFEARLFPNPATGMLKVVLPHGDAAETVIELFTPAGSRRAVSPAAVSPGELLLNLHGLQPGLYVLRITSGSHSLSRRLVVAR